VRKVSSAKGRRESSEKRLVVTEGKTEGV
jgi:hypothetical protein